MATHNTITPPLQKQLVEHAKKRIALKCPKEIRSFTSDPVVSMLNPDVKKDDVCYTVSWSDHNKTLSVECILARPMGCLDMGIYFTDYTNRILRKQF